MSKLSDYFLKFLHCLRVQMSLKSILLGSFFSSDQLVIFTKQIRGQPGRKMVPFIPLCCLNLFKKAVNSLLMSL